MSAMSLKQGATCETGSWAVCSISGDRVSGQHVNLGLSGNQLLAPHHENSPREQILHSLLCIPDSLIFNCTYTALTRGVSAQQFLKSPSSSLGILPCSTLAPFTSHPEVFDLH